MMTFYVSVIFYNGTRFLFKEEDFMKSVTIKNQSSWESESIEEINAEHGFTISCNGEDKEAVIFDLSKGCCSKVISKDNFENLWNKLMEINFQKVLLENEPHQGCDGGYSIVEVSVGLQYLTLTLWSPDIDLYKEHDFSESLKLLNIVNEIIDFAASKNVAAGFVF